MLEQPPPSYEFEGFRLDIAKRLLLRNGEIVPLVPKAFDILRVLIERRGETVGKDELFEAVWNGAFVEENNLNVNVSALRKIFKEKPREHRFIVTVPGHGYKFVAEVRVIKNAAESNHSGNGAGAAIKNYDLDNVVLHTEAFLAPAVKTGTPTQANAARKVSDGSGSKTRRRKILIVGACAILILIIGGFAFLRFNEIKLFNPAFRQISLNRLTNSGKAKLVALSPDGNLIAYVSAEPEGNSLSVRQVGMSNTITVVPPRSGEFICLTFSPDGKLIYYSFFPGDKMEAEFYSVPALGGFSRKIPNLVNLAMSVAPDGKRFVNTTSDTGGGETGLAIVNFDGGEKRQLATRKMPRHFSVAGQVCSWSPNGEIIAAVGNDVDEQGSYSTLVGVSVEGGAEKPLSAKRWVYLESIEWLKSGNGLLVVGSDQPAMPSQIWFISYPDGGARRLTNDLSNYSSLGVSADEQLIVSVQSTQTNTIWIGEIGQDQNSFRQITSETGSLGPLELTSDERLVFRSNADGNSNLWAMQISGGERRQITADSNADMRGLCVTADSKQIVFVSSRAGKSNLWRVDMNGENLTRLTMGEREAYPVCSSDNQFVIYQKGFGAGIKSTLWKVSIEGGEPSRLTDYFAFRPALSPDDSRVAFFYMTEDKWRIGIVSASGGAIQQSFDVPDNVPDRFLRWSPNNRDLLYVANIGEVGNLRQLSPDGQSKQITDFNTNYLETFAVSPNGKKLAVTRTSSLSDVISINSRK